MNKWPNHLDVVNFVAKIYMHTWWVFSIHHILQNYFLKIIIMKLLNWVCLELYYYPAYLWDSFFLSSASHFIHMYVFALYFFLLYLTDNMYIYLYDGVDSLAENLKRIFFGEISPIRIYPFFVRIIIIKLMEEFYVVAQPNNKRSYFIFCCCSQSFLSRAEKKCAIIIHIYT